jgi:hypothetical protein
MKNACVTKVRRIFRRDFQDVAVTNAVVNKLREKVIVGPPSPEEQRIKTPSAQ